MRQIRVKVEWVRIMKLSHRESLAVATAILFLARVFLDGADGSAPGGALGASPATSDASRIIKVYLQAGQSNADGRALTNGLPDSFLEPQADIPYYYYLTGSPANSDGTLGTLTTLRPGCSALGGGATFGPELTLGRTLADYFGKTNNVPSSNVTVAILKYAHGGTALYNAWRPNGNSTPSGEGVDYITFQRVAAAGLNRLAAAYPDAAIELGGMIWVQGETDIDLGTLASSMYGTNLVKFIKDVRLTYAARQPYGTNLPFFLSRISANQTVYSNPADPDHANYLLVRAGQEAAAAALPNVFMLDTDPPAFSMATPWSGPGLHYDTRGQQSLGTAFALAIIRALPPPRWNGIEQSAAGWRISFAGVTGASHTIERAPSVAGPWDLLMHVLVGSGGLVEFDDANPPSAGAFYRVSRP